MPVAESEIVTGPYTEYSGMRFIFFYMSEFAHVVALSALGNASVPRGMERPDPSADPLVLRQGGGLRGVLHLGPVHDAAPS